MVLATVSTHWRHSTCESASAITRTTGSVPEGLPFEDESFDVIINRHGDLSPKDFHRLLKPGGLFITQQVGAENDRDLVKLLCGDVPMPFPEQYLEKAEKAFCQAGFSILERAKPSALTTFLT